MKILAINYSQTGQLDQIMNNLIESIPTAEIDRQQVEMIEPYEFPWKRDQFFDLMPNAVHEVSAPIKELHFKHEKYDLIILGYQPWFLSPSIPTTSLLNYQPFLDRIKDTKIITVIGARNMWMNSQEAVVTKLENAGGDLVANIPFVDRAPNLAGAISIVHWLLRGKKERRWGIFPLPGISEDDIASATGYGELLTDLSVLSEKLQEKVMSRGLIKIPSKILFIEARAKKIFRIWAGIIDRKSTTKARRKRWITFFRLYLNFALYFVSPIIYLIYSILIRPFCQGKIRKRKEHYYYLGIN